jgi:UDP-2,3-diacylglucosamine pyrophosphatase LpxH
MRKLVRWLHISDIHFRESKRLDQNDAFRRIREDLTTRKTEGRSPDLIFVTGDLTHSGLTTDYQAISHLLSDLCDECGLSHQEVFFCPGNHDSDIRKAPILIRGCWSSFNDVAALQTFLDSLEYLALKERQADYRSFVRAFRGDSGGFDSHDLHAVAHLSLDELRVGVLSINSALLAEGGPADHGRLQVCVRLLEDRCKDLRDSDLRFALVHHPFEWLSEFEADRAEKVVLDSCDVLLRGHIHRPNLGRSLRGGILSTAGAVWAKTASDYEYSHGSFALNTLNCEIESVRFIQQTGKWMRNVETHTLPRDRTESCVPSVIRAALGNSLKFPAQIAAILAGYNSELMMTRSGSPNYFSLEMISAVNLNREKGPLPAIGVMGAATLFSFFGLRELETILKSELPALVDYDNALRDACASDAEFGAIVSARETTAERLANIAPPDKTWASRLLSRLVSQGDSARISALRSHSEDDHLLADLKAKIAGGSRDPYEAWRTLHGPELEYAELAVIATRLAMKGTADLANLALADATNRFPTEARQLDSIARAIAAELSEPSVYINFRSAVGLE